jgi:hypothetical protein
VRDAGGRRPANPVQQATGGKLSPAVQGALARVYVPNLQSNDVYGSTRRPSGVDKFRVGLNPQHVVPSGPEDALGRQQRREHDARQSDADRSDDGRRAHP